MLGHRQKKLDLGLKNRLKPFLANERGVTLLEIITVVSFIAVLSSVAIPNFSKWGIKHQINSESQKLYMDLMLARISAIKNNNDVLVTLDTTNNRYIILDDSNSDGTANTGETVKTVDLIPQVEFGFFGSSITDMDGNVVGSPVTLASGGNVITFDSKGQASTSGSIYLIHKSDVGLSNARTRGISMVQATGGADLWKYDASTSPPWS